jgi:hypothetical protein
MEGSPVIAVLDQKPLATRRKARKTKRARRAPAGKMLVFEFRDSGVVVATAGEDAAIEQFGALSSAAGDCKRVNVALLPKSAYVLRVIELPLTPPAEVATAIGLEIEARLPQQYGEFDFSYRSIASAKQGMVRYEAYAARRAALHRTIEIASSAGIALDWMLPSAALWRHFLDTHEAIHVLVLMSPDGGGEAVFVEPSGGTAVREIPPSELSTAPGALPPSLVDCLRSRATRLEPGTPLTVAWIGQDRPDAERFGQGRMRIVPCLHGNGNGAPPAQILVPLLLAAQSAPTVLGTSGAALNLLPSDVIDARARRETLRRLAVISALLALMLLFTCSALRVLLWRYRTMNEGLSTDIAAIRVDADSVGTRLAQLRAIRAASESRASFFHITESLFDCTPPGVSYSQLELHDDGRFDIRGQADSLAQPFVLPEKMQATGTFQQVLLRDASQSAHGDGSLVEFRIDANRSKAP